MSWAQERARYAALTRSRSEDDPELRATKRRMKAARMGEWIAARLDDGPELTPAERVELASLLTGGQE